VPLPFASPALPTYEEAFMRIMALFFVAVVFVSAATLTSRPAQALAAGVRPPVTHPIGKTSCVRQHVCGFRRCIWHTICR